MSDDFFVDMNKTKRAEVIVVTYYIRKGTFLEMDILKVSND